MKCMHCLVEFHDNEQRFSLTTDIDGFWIVTKYLCPVCKKANLFLINQEIVGTREFSMPGEVVSKIPIHPKGISRPPCPLVVPKEIAKDYNESCVTLYDSPNASAALSRRCLQNILRDKIGVKKSNLASEIQEAISNKQLPSDLIDLRCE